MAASRPVQPTDRSGPERRIRAVLWVEEDCHDHLVSRLLSHQGPHRYQISFVTAISDARAALRTRAFDVIVLDTGRDDRGSTREIRELRAMAPVAPLVALIESEADDLLLEGIGAGAQECLCTREIQPRALSRVIERAIESAIQRRRHVEQPVGQLPERFRVTSSHATPATPAGATLRERRRDVFNELVEQYVTFMDGYFDHRCHGGAKPRPAMLRFARRLGELQGEPRDLLDLHVTALDRAAHEDDRVTLASAQEGRLLVIEMMGLLADYYRKQLAHTQAALAAPAPTPPTP